MLRVMSGPENGSVLYLKCLIAPGLILDSFEFDLTKYKAVQPLRTLFVLNKEG